MPAPMTDWTVVDWSLSNSEIAAVTNATRTAVYKARRRAALGGPRRKPAIVDLTRVDWFGRSNAEIAAESGVSDHTVSVYRQRALGKLAHMSSRHGVCSRCGAKTEVDRLGKSELCRSCLCPEYDYTDPRAIEGCLEMWAAAAEAWRREEDEMVAAAMRIRAKLPTLGDVPHTDTPPYPRACGCAPCQQRLSERMIARAEALHRTARKTHTLVFGE